MTFSVYTITVQQLFGHMSDQIFLYIFYNCVKLYTMLLLISSRETLFSIAG